MSQSRSTGADELARVRAGRAAEERPFEVHAEHRVADAPRVPPARRSSIGAYASSGALQIVGRHAVQPPATRASIVATISSTDARAKSTAPAPFTWMSTKPGREQRVAEVDRVGGRGTGAGGDDAAVGHHEPGRRGRGTAFAVEDPRRDERGHPWRSRNNAMRSFTKPSSVRGTRFTIDVRAGRSSVDADRDLRGAQPGALDAQDQLGVEEVLTRAARRARTARPRRGASP